MQSSPRFKVIFTKLRETLEQDEDPKERTVRIRIRTTTPITPEELDAIDEVRRVVLEVTEPESISYTTT